MPLLQPLSGVTIFCPCYNLYGKDPATKLDEFFEKFQTAFDPPPPHFWKITLQFFYNEYGCIYQGGIGHIVLVNINTIVEKTYPEP